MVMAVLLFATLVAIYAFWIRPILQSRPAFRELYDKEESFFAALREKLKGIKQRLSSAIVIIASAAVSGYDFFAPIVGGVDVSSLAAQVPAWAWPLILIAVTALYQFLRNLSDKRHQVEIAGTNGLSYKSYCHVELASQLDRRTRRQRTDQRLQSKARWGEHQ